MIIGHQKKVDFLKKSAEKNRVSHGYLFYGQEKIGKKKIAIELAKTLQCLEKNKPCGLCKNCRDIDNNNHPDLVIIGKEEKSGDGENSSGQISISKIRNLRKTLSLSPYLGNYKIAIIDDAHCLNIHSANALLKTLEEPKGKAVIILVSSHPNLLPKTIRSRLQQIKFSLVPKNILAKQLEGTAFKEEQKDEILKIIQGRPGVLVEILSDSRKKDGYKLFMKNFLGLAGGDLNARFEYIKKVSENKDDSLKFLEGLAVFFRDLFLIKAGVKNLIVNSFIEKELTDLSERYSRDNIEKIIKLISRLGDIITNSNINQRICLEVLMLEI